MIQAVNDRVETIIVDNTHPIVDVSPINGWVENSLEVNASVEFFSGLDNESCEVGIYNLSYEWNSTGVSVNFSYGDLTGSCSYLWNTTQQISGMNYYINFRTNR